jgi:apolipoprotein N-acyltransferase
MNRLRGQSRLAQDEGAQVVVWPEAGAFPFAADRPVRRDFFDRRRRVLLLHDLPTIFGVATHAPGNPYEYNTVLAFDEHGKTTGSFDKVNLVPFGEYVPVVDPEWARELVPAMAHNNTGEGAVRFEIDPPTTGESYATEPFGAGPLICFEDILADFSREVAGVPEGIDVFVNVTIDTWFGDTAEPWEHLGLAQFRSVEHRIPMVRAVAAGTSSYVDLTGRLAASLPVRAPTAEHMVPAERLVVDVPMSRNTARDPTPYARGGWLLQWWCILVGVAGAGMPLARSVRKKYRARARDPSDE